LPPELTSAQGRRERLLAAKAELIRQAEEQQRQERAERERLAEHVPPRGLPAVGSGRPDPQDRLNLSDPESTLTPGKKEKFIQGYNAQLSVSVPSEKDEPSLILAAAVARDTNDLRQLEPMTRQTVENLQAAPIEVLVDRGYDNTAHMVVVEKNYGSRVVCPPVHVANQKPEPATRYRWEKERRRRRDERRERFQSAEEQTLYQRRNTTVEPAFGIIKDALGFTRFRLRGLAKVQMEWRLVGLAFNCRRLAHARAVARAQKAAAMAAQKAA
jgi:hypothetical protein